MFKLVSRTYSNLRSFREIKIPVPWGHIAGKWWGPQDQRPVLTVHGWQDNCGSFDRLLPLLNEDVAFLAIDLPGHGLSSKLPAGMLYHNMNYPILIDHISQHFKWKTVALMGHSLGGISCYIYTMLFPEKVDFMIGIDGLKPIYKKNNGPRMAEGIKEFLKYNKYVQSPDEPPCYTMEQLLSKVPETIFAEHYHHILTRNLTQSKTESNKYYFSRDPRLKSRLILNWPHQDLLEGAQRVNKPLLVIKFTESGYYEEKEYFYELVKILEQTSKDFQLHYVEGLHHTHLNDPENVARLVNNFIKKYHMNETITDQSIVQNTIQV